MFSKYIKLIFRNYKKNLFYTILNLIGLSIGLALVFLIVLYVRHETTYDCYNKNADRIYRITTHNHRYDWITSGTSNLLAPVLREEFPEIEKAARTRGMIAEIEFDGNLEQNFFHCVDPEILDILTLDFVYGSKENALTEPYDILLSETRAEKHFPGENPIGKILPVNMYGETIDFTVKGVLKNVPANATFKMPFLVRRETSDKFFQFINNRYGADEAEWNYDHWFYTFFQTFILVKEKTDINNLREKLNEIPEKYHDEGMETTYDLQALRDIYLHSDNFVNNHTRSGNLADIYLFSGIAFLILFIACTNFIILSTAQSVKRSKEIAVRKILGAERKKLIQQILFESVFTAFLACFLAIGFTYLLLPGITEFLNVSLEINYLQDYVYPLSLLGITLLVGIASGSYVALYLSRLDPLIILKGNTFIANSKSLFRKVVICLQMIIFICLISASITIFKQLNFAKNADLGFDKEQLLTVELTSGDFSEHYSAFMEELRKNPEIIEATGSFNSLPEDGQTVGIIHPVDDSEQEVEVEYYSVDYNFFNTLGIEFDCGRTFSREFATDVDEAIIINETAVKELHISKPLEETLEDDKVIGVIKDFHFHSFYMDIQPTIFRLCPTSHIEYVNLRISPHNVQKTIKFIEQTWKKFNAGKDAPFEYYFIDESIDQLYWKAQNFGKAINYCTLFAIFVACLGLFGLTMFTTQQKSKEIGIRKIFGASPIRILQHLSKEIVWLSVIASIVAIPMVIYLMNKWLMNFAYKTELSFWIFILAGAAGMLVSLLTMSFFSIKASLSNPVKTMKYE